MLQVQLHHLPLAVLKVREHLQSAIPRQPLLIREEMMSLPTVCDFAIKYKVEQVRGIGRRPRAREQMPTQARLRLGKAVPRQAVLPQDDGIQAT
jgi:hypothetical protein